MNDFQKWMLAIFIGVGCGMLSAATDATPPTTWDLIRHGAIGVLPTLGALQMNLRKDLGIGE